MRNFLIIILAFTGLISCAKPEGFVIKGQIKGKESGEVKLMKYADGKWITEDSTKIEKGKFVQFFLIQILILKCCFARISIISLDQSKLTRLGTAKPNIQKDLALF